MSAVEAPSSGMGVLRILIIDWRDLVVRSYWVTFECRGVRLIWIIARQGPIALAVGAGGGCLDE